MVNEILENSVDPLYGPNVISFTPLFNTVLTYSNGAIRPNDRNKLTTVLIGLGFTKLTRCRLQIDSDKDNRHALWAKIPENIDSTNAISWAVNVIESRINSA